MKPWSSIGPFLFLLTFAGCAETRPVYFGADARPLHENGADYWEGVAQAPSYLSVRMRRRRQSPALDATVYAGTLSLQSIAPAVMRSTFTMTEGASASFHFDFNSDVARELARSGRTFSYFPDTLDVVVVCAQGACGAQSKPLEISPQGNVELKSMPIIVETRAPARSGGSAKAAAESLAKDNECAILHDSLESLRERDASIRSFTAKYGEAETSAMARRVQRSYARKGCAAWLEERGGVGAAWRRVRVSQWTTLRGN